MNTFETGRQQMIRTLLKLEDLAEKCREFLDASEEEIYEISRMESDTLEFEVEFVPADRLQRKLDKLQAEHVILFTREKTASGCEKGYLNLDLMRNEVAQQKVALQLYDIDHTAIAAVTSSVTPQDQLGWRRRFKVLKALSQECQHEAKDLEASILTFQAKYCD